ncbi:unnamed protein product (mitochondrion) [Plasmodiophora brassicae]|uniref:Uncharacterized protein n=1 Tax=Plasmodiophora brassicae TaxID=37360 RepID=A0A3P3YF38_PLABS|nr:unnamed protein product [Plasmodiophora brassicae]
MVVVGGAGASGRPSKPRIGFTLANVVEEDHGTPIYGLCFNDVDPDLCDCFATVGANRATVYRLNERTGAVEPEQIYRDSDSNETFYTCLWMAHWATGAPLLVCAGLTGSIKVIDCSTRAPIKALLGHVGAVNEVRACPTNPVLLLSASKDRSVRLWNIETTICVAVFSGEAGHMNEVLSADFSLDGLIELSGTDAYKHSDLDDCNLARAPFPTKLFQFPIFSTDRVHSNYVDNVRFFGDMILSKSVEEKIVLWVPSFERKTVNESCPVRVLQECLYSDCDIWYVRFSLDRPMRLVATGNSIGKVFIWDVGVPGAAPRVLTSAKSTRTIRHVAFNHNNIFLVASSDIGSVFVWRRQSKKDRRSSYILEVTTSPSYFVDDADRLSFV